MTMRAISIFLEWGRRLWHGKYLTLAECMVCPHLRQAELIGLIACAISLVTTAALGAEYLERSGAVIVVAGILMEQRIARARSAADSISFGIVSPSGVMLSAHLPGQFAMAWQNEKIRDVPVQFWLMGQHNRMLRLESWVTWLLIVGTLVWGYGKPMYELAGTVISMHWYK